MTFRFVFFLLAVVAMLAPAARAAAPEELAEVNRLHHAGQTAAALQRADQALAADARDPQMRFLKAVMLADTGRNGEAIAALIALTQDYPDLAEPYNNLAVLHAAAGDYVKARAALDQALRLNPNYATAHENLGDIYAALAADSYATALRLDPARAGMSGKLAIARQLAAPAKAAAAAPAASPAAPR